jgi:hypothetical protein
MNLSVPPLPRDAYNKLLLPLRIDIKRIEMGIPPKTMDNITSGLLRFSR